MKKVIITFFLFLNMSAFSNLEKLNDGLGAYFHKQNQMNIMDRDLGVKNEFIIAKEFLYLIFYLMLYKNIYLINDKILYCNKCNKELNFFYIYTICIYDKNEKILKIFKKLLLKKDKQRLTQFLIKLCNVKSIDCIYCNGCFGWNVAQ